MEDFHMNLHYFQHGNDSNDYTFTLPETTTVDEEELEIDIYEVGFRIGALNNDGTVTYTHTDETTQENVLEGQDNTDIENMFEDVVYNIYDTLETFIESFTITINDWSLLDNISFKYIQPTTLLQQQLQQRCHRLHLYHRLHLQHHQNLKHLLLCLMMELKQNMNNMK